MSKLLMGLKSFFKEDTGATAIEYGLLVGLIAAVIVVVVTALGTTLEDKFTSILCALGGSPETGSCPE
jgi:pilus assembly protein Flp/PilA